MPGSDRQRNSRLRRQRCRFVWHPSAQIWPQAVACALQQQQHQDTEHNGFEIAVGAQQFRQQRLQLIFQQGQECRSENRAPHITGAAHHSHEQVFDTGVEAERCRTYRALQMRIQPAGDASQQCRQHKDQYFYPSRVDAHCFGHYSTAVERADSAARARVQQVLQTDQRHQQDRPDKIKHLAPRIEIDAKQVKRRDAVQAIVFAEELQVAEQKIQRQRPGDRAERQIVA